jgi:hypothetical protein
MDWTPNGLNPECTEPRLDWTPNGPNSEWTEPRMYWTLNGPNSEWSELRIDSTPNGTQPRMDSTPTGTEPRLRLNSEWDSTSTILSTSNGVQWQGGVHQKNAFKKRSGLSLSLGWVSVGVVVDLKRENTSFYFSQRRLSGPQHTCSAPCWRSWKL